MLPLTSSMEFSLAAELAIAVVLGIGFGFGIGVFEMGTRACSVRHAAALAPAIASRITRARLTGTTGSSSPCTM